AERGQQSLDKAQAESGDIVDNARKQATTILDQAHARANEIIAEGKSSGVKERERQLAAATADVEQETNRAREELRGQVSAIAVASAEKILRREIDPKAHADILSDLANEL
ncbi:MAG: F0F1 ATP synthase subunit B, partial [Woeseiales bacterium]